MSALALDTHCQNQKPTGLTKPERTDGTNKPKHLQDPDDGANNNQRQDDIQDRLRDVRLGQPQHDSRDEQENKEFNHGGTGSQCGLFLTSAFLLLL